MFYSQWLLSKRGPLGIIWFAAHCYKRLKKEQVAQTNISSSVDQILLDEVPVVTYRILGYLLLGVVRIYSKKVEHLFHDCRDFLIKINDFAGSKKANLHMEAICAPYLSITLPERFELDAFDLEILEDLSGGNVRPHEEITIKDAWKNEGIGHYSFEKYHFEEDAAHFETCFTAYTPVRDVRSPHLLDSDMVASASHNLSNLEASMEKLRGKRFSTEECLDPMMLVEAEEEPCLVGPFGGEHQTGGEQIKFLDTEVFFGAEKEPPDLLRSFDDEQQTDEVQMKFPEMISPESIKCQLTMQEHPVSIAINVTLESKSPNARNLEATMEKLRGKRFSMEECLDSMMLGEAEEEPSLVGPFGGEHQTDGEQIKFLDTEMFFGAEKEPSDILGSFDDKQQTDEVQIKFPEMISPESIESRQTMKDHLVFAINVTPESNIPDASGAGAGAGAGATTPDYIVVRTPAAKEFEKVSRKRRCFFDDIIVLPNQLLKQQIDNSSDLICKRRKAPHTALRVWKANQISSLPRSFLEPLLPDISSELRSLFCKRKLKTPKPVENVEAPENVDVLGSPTVHCSLNQIANALSTPVVEAPENVDVIGSPIVHRSPDQTDIAPSTPVTHSTSVRLHAVAEISNSDRVGPASSFESIRKEPSQCENQEFDISLLDEEVNSLEGDKQEMYGWSMRTRTVAGYLHRSFLNEKTRRANAEVNLLQVLKGKTRKESARLFYEILVLKAGEFVDVKQDNAYGAILVLETTKLLESCEVDTVYAS